MDRSTLTDLNQAIERHNPFSGLATLEEPDVWRSRLPDFAKPHQQAMAAVRSALDRLKTERRVIPLTVLGEIGTGKTHLLAQVCQNLKDSGDGTFIYIDIQQFVESSTVRQVLLNAVAHSLTRKGASGFMQWQELASALADRAFQSIDPSTKTLTPELAVRRLRGQAQDRNRHWIDRVTEAFFKVRPDIDDPDVVRAVLWTLAPAQAPFARKWLSGRSLAPWKLDELGLPDRTQEPRESRADELLREIFNLLEDWQPLVVACDRFDGEEIEETDEDDDPLEDEWDMRVPLGAIVRLSQMLRGLRCSHGALLLSVMEPQTWDRIVQPILGRMTRHLSDRPNPLQLPDADEATVRGIVGAWLKQFYSDRKLVPPSPLYPFDAEQIRALAREKADLHDAITWCAENFRPVENDPFERVSQAFDRSLNYIYQEGEIHEYDAIDALQLGFESLIGSTVEGIEVQAVERDVAAQSRTRKTLHLKISGLDRNYPIAIGIMVVFDERGQTVGNRLRTLCDWEDFGLTRGILVRPHNREIPPRWKAHQWLDRLVESGGSWVDISFDDIAPLMALGDVLNRRHPWGLSKERVLGFASSKGLATGNSTIRDILRSPAAQTPSPLSTPRDTPTEDRSSQPHSSDIER